ncbi:serine protease [Sphingorhabdus sp. IMCC26285]|uniref:Serine protease n=1 Tax=Sphingorhabdus profundilacus TaxID=2509718 RepID=A0A6I4M4G9_9SPHN|nr:serine protease [Sphingorhabdus profundilacus]MVZ98760.1 serine protease [Sphingorhabdus profundilacus]
MTQHVRGIKPSEWVFYRHLVTGLLLLTAFCSVQNAFAQQLDAYQDGLPLDDVGDSSAETVPAPNSLPTAVPSGWIIGANEPTADARSDQRPITIGFRQNLGRDMKRMQDFVARDWALQIGWPAEFEMSRSFDDPSQLVLIDMLHQPPFIDMADTDISFIANNYDAVAISREVNSAIMIGNPDAPGFAEKFYVEIAKIIRARALIANSFPANAREYALCAEKGDRPCPETGQSRITDLGTNDKVHFALRNESQEPQFVYVFLIDPENELRLVIGGPTPLEPGAMVEAKGEPVELKQGRYHIFILRSDRPIDDALFLSDIGKIDPSKCSEGVAESLCAILSGQDISIPRGSALWDRGWSMNVETIAAVVKKTVTVGGGDVAKAGFAPWQVQIYSNQTYSKAQIAKDTEAGAKGKSLAKQLPFQLYHRCAGSLIAKNIVLTAAHCVAHPPVDGTNVLRTREVLVGTQTLSQGGARYRIVSAVVHKGYKPGSQKDDIAVVRIEPIAAPATQYAIKLPDDVAGFSKVVAGSKISVLGWGFTGVVGRTERHERTRAGPQFAQDKLRIAAMQAYDTNACKLLSGYQNIDKKICAITPEDRTKPGNSFSCRGDSGGPVIQQSNGRVVQVGLVSGGVGCGANENGKQNPSLFVDLAQYTTWIKNAETRVRAISNAVEPMP